MLTNLSLLAFMLANMARAQTPGSIVEVGDTLVSAMMMFVGNQQKVYILDKAEGNQAQINGHPAWGSVWDINTQSATPMDVYSNTFCSSGMHLPNGSYVTFGGNGAIGPGGNAGSVPEPGSGRSLFDAVYRDYDGTKAIRILNPCTGANPDLVANPQCGWWEDANVLSMQRARWYSTVEPMGDGTLVIIGGFVNGGYINRNYPNDDPTYSHGASEPTFEFFPSNGATPQVLNFVVQTSGLNSYPHVYLMPSGKMFIQANISTTLWDPMTNIETPLPGMPGNVVRVYPASGATAMLPLTPANNYTPTMIFCGGSDMPDYAWGNFSWPFINTWDYPASNDCQRITPEPQDGSSPVYEQDDNMLETRTMGHFVALPDGKMLVLNGGLNGTAGYSTQTLITLSYSNMPYGMSLASGPVGRPSIYDPAAPKGSRWSSSGLATSSIPRLYHSSAMLLPDSSVLIAGSNPNVDVNTSTLFPTTYKAEIFYPPYYTQSRPVPTGIPSTLSYGGSYFDISVPASSYSGPANSAADNTKIMLIRTGFTTHGMSMGQRALQLNNTHTVNANGSIVFHVSQMPPNPHLFQPGPALLFVTINGIPSNGTYLIVGSGRIETQNVAAVSPLPPSVGVNSASGSGPGSSGSASNHSSSPSTGILIGAIVGAIAIVGIVGAFFGIYLSRRRVATSQSYSQDDVYAQKSVAGAYALRNSDSSAFIPLQPSNHVMHNNWDGSTVNLVSPMRSHPDSGRSGEFEPYYEHPPRMSTSAGPSPY